MKKISVGQIRSRVMLLKPLTSKDSFGQEITTLTEKQMLWASIEPISGREFTAFQENHKEITYKVVVRYQTGISNKMHVRFGERHLEIVNVLEADDRKKYLCLLCKEVV